MEKANSPSKQMHREGRENQMYRTMNGMMPNPMDPNFQQMMRFNNGVGGDLRQKALQNQQQNGVRGYVNSASTLPAI